MNTRYTYTHKSCLLEFVHLYPSAFTLIFLDSISSRWVRLHTGHGSPWAMGPCPLRRYFSYGPTFFIDVTIESHQLHSVPARPASGIKHALRAITGPNMEKAQ